MVALAPAREPELDQRVILHRVSWKAFEAMLALRGDKPAPRMYYLDGEIELLSPARTHEGTKTLLGRLLELWALEADVDLEGFGSWTLKNAPKEAGAEPDECYIVGDANKPVPDLVIEVEWSRSVGLPKQEIYRRLGVKELWTITKEAQLVIRVLERGRWATRSRSKVLPKLDASWLLSFAFITPQSKAVRALRDALRKPRRPARRS
jgi:Uma2 family endonuclease